MRFIIALLLFAYSFHMHSQYMKPDSVWYQKKRFHYAGIQTNLLLQQFISFNSNSSINSNPFLFTYSTTNAKTGGGFALGTGISINQSSSNDGVASIAVQNINVSIRLGGEKKYLQRTRFIPFWGIDMGMGGLYNKTTSTLNQSFNNSTSTVETSKYFFGPSLRAGLNYAITRHILLGTEFFFNAQIAYTETRTSNQTNFSSSSSVIPFNIGFQTPTALFLLFRY